MTPPFKHRLRVLAATCLGLGYSPIMPGTCGALLGVAIYLPIGLWVPDEPWQTLLIAAALVISTAITIALGPWAETHFAEKDSSKFVTDEVAGFLLTVLLFHPPLVNVWMILLWAFPVTRAIDIIKIPPAKQLEKLPAGWGVVVDDLMGSVYAALLLHVLYYFLPAAFGVGS